MVDSMYMYFILYGSTCTYASYPMVDSMYIYMYFISYGSTCTYASYPMVDSMYM